MASVKRENMIRRALVISVLVALGIAATANARSAKETPWDTLTGFPAYVSMQTYHPPAISSVMGKTHLFYEIFVLNAYGADIDVRALTIHGGGKTVTSFSGQTLAEMIRPIGRPDTKPSRTIAAAETAVLYVDVPFATAHDVPAVLDDELTISIPEAGNHVATLNQAPLHVSARTPIVIRPPLAGDGWFAGGGPSNDSGHRRAIFFRNGRPYHGQRLAIDWLQGKIDGSGHVSFYRGDPKQNASWYCWNAPLYAVADGVVVGERTDLPENVPLEPPVVRVSAQTIGGNYVVIDIGFGRYAFYAHMRPHSAAVKAGDRVKAGQIIGRLGNTGNSTAPHLHFHITDAPEFIFAEGEPYAFAAMRAATTTSNEDPEVGAQLSSAFVTYANTMPGNGAVVDFGAASAAPEP